LNGSSYEAAAGYVVEFTVEATDKTAERPHGIRYALVFRPHEGIPYVRFDKGDPGRPYSFTTAAQLLDELLERGQARDVGTGNSQ
jgi:hypothetical protein